MKTSSQPPPDQADGAGRERAPQGAVEPTSQPALSRRRLELPDGRYELAYERADAPVEEEVRGDA
jgi:hypothetical protein